ncbi:MAG: NfeD family protein [Gammaproteobacteria bacterium]|nr:NfeD family protein [Gammaproteobacteria bacterium]
MLEQLDFWHWWIFAAVLLIVETLAPGAFFLWMGISAAIVGMLLYLIPDMASTFQWLVFAVLSVATIVIWRARLKSRPTETDHPTLNRRGTQYVDRVFTLSEPIVNGRGKITVDDSTWKIAGDDCEAGSKVRVNGVDGVILHVNRID